MQWLGTSQREPSVLPAVMPGNDSGLRRVRGLKDEGKAKKETAAVKEAASLFISDDGGLLSFGRSEFYHG